MPLFDSGGGKNFSTVVYHVVSQNHRVSFWRIARVTFESRIWMISSNSRPECFSISLRRRVPMTFDCISILGIFSFLRGVTRVLAAKRLQSNDPSVSCQRTCAVVHIASLDPSFVTISVGFPAMGTFGLMHLLNFTFSASFTSLRGCEPMCV